MLALRRIASLSVCAFALALLAGCGDAKLTPVEGKITVDDAPLKTGNVTFHPDADKGNKKAQSSPPVGTIENGKYTISTNGKPGAPAGWYKVSVRSAVPSDPKDEYSLPKSLIADKFNEPATSGLAVEVKEGGSYDLKVTK